MASCLVAFGDNLEAQYRGAFLKLSPRERGTAMGIFRATLWQLVQHEYAHHYLDHAAKLNAGKITRVDAEFEADLFAITNSVQAGLPVTAMYYFFDGLADIEGYTRKLSTPDYESGACRAKNVEEIATFIGIAPIFLLDAAGGGHAFLARNSPNELRAAMAKQFGGSTPKLEPGYCGHIVTVALPTMFDELKHLSERISSDANMLFSRDEDVDVERASHLVRDLAAMSERFEYANGVAAGSIARMLRNWGLKGRGLTPLVREVDQLVKNDKVTGNFQSADFGRLLAADGLAMLQEHTDVPVPARYSRSLSLLEGAVAYDSQLSEAWMNLAFIAFKGGDCQKAALLADNSVATHSPEDQEGLKGAEFIARSMRELSQNAAACASRAARFSPYPGL